MRESRTASDRLAAALAEGAAREEEWGGLSFCRFSDDYHGVLRGTLVVHGRVLPAFPSIGRIFVLERGLRRSFRDSFLAEEKLDGYNVRIAQVDGQILPFTRGGFVCPFTADRLADLVDVRPFFAAHPELILCGEVVGPANPYIDTSSPRVADDIALFCFDAMRFDEATPLPLVERDRLLTEFGLPRAPVLGEFTPDETDRLRAELLRLDAEGAEGAVFKPPADGLRVKYVTPTVNVRDIALDGVLLAELPAEFFLGRLIRLAMGLDELALLDRVEAAEREIGHALLSRFLPVLRDVAAGGKVRKVFRVRVHTSTAADRLMVHLNRVSKKVQVRELSRRQSGPWIEVELEKTFQQSTARLKSLLEGDFVLD